MFKRLTHARFARAGIATAVIAAAVIVAVSAGALTGGSKSQAANPMSMTITNPASAAVGSSFAANVIGADPGAAVWGGYNVEIGYNPSSYLGGDHHRRRRQRAGRDQLYHRRRQLGQPPELTDGARSVCVPDFDRWRHARHHQLQV